MKKKKRMGGGTDPQLGKKYWHDIPCHCHHLALWLRVGTEIGIFGIPVSQAIVSLWNITI
jgi:hypothetical protein